MSHLRARFLGNVEGRRREGAPLPGARRLGRSPTESLTPRTWQRDRRRALVGAARGALAAILLALGAGPAWRSAAAAEDDSVLLKDARIGLEPLPKDMAAPEFPITPALVDLGRALYFDPRISIDGTVSCARCHQPALYGTDGLSKSRGARDRINQRNAPTVLNAALQIKQNWRGDRENVEEQATKALVEPPLYGQPNFGAAMDRLKAVAGYLPMFQRAFPEEADPVTPRNWGKAIGAYERTLVTPSRFDAFLAGDLTALSPEEKKGLRKFIDVGCIDCHSGPGVGGGMIQKFGLKEDYWKETKSTRIDKGRFDITHDPSDMYFFKVPSLRNVAMTAPYFHDGSVRSLEDAVRIMARVQIGTSLSAEDTRAIVAFLDSLTGALPSQFAAALLVPADH